MNNYERTQLLWDYLTDFDLDAFVYQDEIDNEEAYFDAENCEIILAFDGKKCRILIEEIEETANYDANKIVSKW